MPKLNVKKVWAYNQLMNGYWFAVCELRARHSSLAEAVIARLRSNQAQAILFTLIA